MRDWLNRPIGGAPRWLLLLLPVAVLTCGALFVSSLLGSTPAPARSIPAYTPVPAASAKRFDVPADPRLLVFGDSYTEGFAASPTTLGYANLVGKALGWRTDVQGIGGTGYTYGGPGAGTQDYGNRIRTYIRTSSFAPNVIVLEGSQNDYRSVDTITQTVLADVKLLQQAYPNAAIVLFGPAAPQPLLSRLGPIDSAVQAAAEQAGLPYISPYSGGWLTDANTRQYGYSDGSHLNTEGHAYLAQRFLTAFKPLFGL